jgi:hypothetical protein
MGTSANWSRDSVVSTATAYGLDDRWAGVPSPSKVKNFLFSTLSTQPLIQWLPRALSTGLKRPRSEVDHSPPASAEVKEMWIYTSTPPYVFMTQYLISQALRQLYLFTFTSASIECLCSWTHIFISKFVKKNKYYSELLGFRTLSIVRYSKN